jgi:Reverse transcriptase (RNA-dependent DNA polymerase)
LINRYKVRIVAKCYKKKHSIEYDEVFAHVARLDTVRILISFTSHHSWKLHQLDVKSAFLNDVLEEEVYVEQPEWFIVKGAEKKIYRLKKTLYGLKQASQAWNARIDDYLEMKGFVKYPFEHALYMKKKINMEF